MSLVTSYYTKKDGTVSVYRRESKPAPSRTVRLLVPNGVHQPFWHKIPSTSILFNEKDYPTCMGCDRKYLHELGCLWCSIGRNGKN